MAITHKVGISETIGSFVETYGKNYIHAFIRKNVFITLLSYSIILNGKNVRIEYLVELNLFEAYFIFVVDAIDGFLGSEPTFSSNYLVSIQI